MPSAPTLVFRPATHDLEWDLPVPPAFSYLVQESADGAHGWSDWDAEVPPDHSCDDPRPGKFYRVFGTDEDGNPVTEYSNVVLDTDPP